MQCSLIKYPQGPRPGRGAASYTRTKGSGITRPQLGITGLGERDRDASAVVEPRSSSGRYLRPLRCEGSDLGRYHRYASDPRVRLRAHSVHSPFATAYGDAYGIRPFQLGHGALGLNKEVPSHGGP